MQIYDYTAGSAPGYLNINFFNPKNRVNFATQAQSKRQLFLPASFIAQSEYPAY